MRLNRTTKETSGWLALLALGALSALPACLLLLPHLSYIPFWDAGDYLLQLRSAALSEFRTRSYFFSQHPTFLFALLMSIPVELAPSRIEALNLASIALFVLSVAAFRAIAHRIRPGHEATIAASCYALCPALLGGVLFFTPDLGVATFFPIYCAALLRSPGPGSAIAGSMLAGSKEAGIALYAASVPLYLLSFGWKGRRAREYAWLSAPAFVIAFVYTALDAPSSRRDFWKTVQISPSSIFHSPEAQGFLADTFVLSFSWIPTLVVVVGACVGLRSFGAPSRTTMFLSLLFVASLYLTTRVPTWNNPRYLIPNYTLLFLLGYTALPLVARGEPVRKAGLLAFGALLGFSCVRSIDPVSSAVFHPLQIGERRLWNLQDGWASWNVSRWPVRDQLVYNLEYLNLHHVIDDILRHVQPDDQSVFAIAPSVNHFKLKFVDPLTHERSVGKPGDIEVRVADSAKQLERIAGQDRPEIIHFVAYPTGHREVNAEWIERLGYVAVERRVFERSGYAMPYVRYEREDSLPAAPPASDLVEPIPQPR